MVGSSELSERLVWAVRHPTKPADQHTVKQLELITVKLAQLRDEIEDPYLLVQPIEQHLALLIDTLRPLQPSPVHDQLCSLAGETAALAGWLRWNMGQIERAEGFFWGGYKAAEEAQDHALAAYLRGCVASRPFHREDPARRLAVLQDAVGATPETASWLLVLEAGAYALQGRTADFNWAINQARETLLRIVPNNLQRPRVSFFDRVYLEEEAAACWLRLSMPGVAQDLLASVRGLASGRMAMWVDLDLALASADQGLPDLATTYALSVLEAAQANHVQPILRSLGALPTRPSMQGCREVAILTEALHSA